MESIESKVKNIDSMQEQAIKRAQLMHQRAKNSMKLDEYEKIFLKPEDIDFNRTNKTKETAKIKNNTIKPQNNAPKIKLNGLDFLLKDSERSLILVLLLLLFEEKCDIGLLLALMYLLI